MVDPVETTLLSTPISAVEAVQYRIPSEPSDLPFIFTMLFKPNLEGLAARAALDSASVCNAIAKRNGTWPELGIKAGRFRPGQLHSEVLQGLGHSQDEISDFFKGKGKGRGKGAGVETAPTKRGASQRLSVTASRDTKRAAT